MPTTLIRLIFLLPIPMVASELPINPRLFEHYWTANWITHPEADPNDFGVYHFRKTFTLTQAPRSLVIHVSADNRYKLFVNGEPIGLGPARGDVENWPFETYDIGPWLKPGKNLIAAQVWNAGKERPWAQHSFKTGLVVQADASAWDSMVNSNSAWKAYHVEAIQPLPANREELRTFIVVGPGDRVNGATYPWGWETPQYADQDWAMAREIDKPHTLGFGTDQSWQLMPRTIPHLESRKEPIGVVRRVEGFNAMEPNIFQQGSPLSVPPYSRARILIDRGHLTVGYPVIRLVGGKGSEIRLTYAEALFDENRTKGNRNDIQGKTLIGIEDVFQPGGDGPETYTTLWLRTYRYLELEIETRAEPLQIDDLHFVYSAYPFEARAEFNSNDPRLKDIWDVGWRTAQLCAGETYYDCPYYEQLQYVGDTRIQALISLYVSGDDRLMRKAIRLFNQSRFHAGLTRSRYPSYNAQVIPPYSLFWINMIHDYLMHRTDLAFLLEQRMGIITVLDWYEQHIDPGTGLIGHTPYWNFVDWTVEWPWDNEARIGGVPDLKGGSSILSLQLAYALDAAATLFEAFEEPYFSEKYSALSAEIKQAVIQHCWDKDRQRFADTTAFSSYSQHANLWAILTGTVTEAAASTLMEAILTDDSLIQATFYFRFYLFQALYQTGMGDRYLEQLEPWHDMLALGLSTFAEKPDPTRSDCHAWSSSPNYDFLATLCGIRPASPGFKTVKIEPFLGPLQEVTARMPHPNGMISASLHRRGDGLDATILLPPGLSGSFVWNGKSYPLVEGHQDLNL